MSTARSEMLWSQASRAHMCKCKVTSTGLRLTSDLSIDSARSSTPLRFSVLHMAAGAMETQQPRYMDGTEIRLARQWLQEEDVFVAEIARRQRRSPFSLWRLFGGKAAAAKGVLT